MKRPPECHEEGLVGGRRVAAKRLGHLFPQLTRRSGFYKRREKLTDVIEALIVEFARHSPGQHDDLLLVDSTPVECARSRETVKRGGSHSLADALTDAADYGYCASHSRFFYGWRLHGLFAPDGMPRARQLNSPKSDERDVALHMLARCGRGGETLIGDKGYTSRAFAHDLAVLDAQILRPRRKDEPGHGPHRAPDPSTHRIDPLDDQGHPHPLTPRRPHPAGPQNPTGLGFRLHGIFPLDGTPRALALTSSKIGERDVCLTMLDRLGHHAPVTIIGDKGYAGREFETDAADLGAQIVRPRRKDEHGRRPQLAPIRQRVESIVQTAKEMLGLEDHGARELHTLRPRLATKFLALTAAIALNHRLGRRPATSPPTTPTDNA